MAKKRGRKSLQDELKIKERYSALTPKFFAVLEKFLNSKLKYDQKWAIEQLNKAYIRMIPQEMEGNINGNMTITWQKEQLQSHTCPESGPDNTSTKEPPDTQ